MATPRNARPGMLLDPGAPINQGLVGWWPMWEGAGGKTLDISGKGNHGTLTNGPVWNGSGLIFDGADDYFVSDASGVGLAAFSISLWVNRGVSATTDQIFQWALTLSATQPFAMLRDTSGVLNYYVNSNYNLPGGTLVDRRLTHLVITWTGATYVSYLDGVQISTYVGGAGFQANATKFWLANGFNGYWKGTINNTRVWSRALSALEVQQLYVNPNIGLWVPDITRYYIPAAGGGFQPAWAANSNVLLGGGMAL